MAKKLEEFKKEYEAVKREVEKADQELDRFGVSRGQNDGMMDEAAKEIGRRVRKLREGGAPGAAIDDFKNDPEVRKLLAGIDSYMATIKKLTADERNYQSGPVKKLETRYQALRRTTGYAAHSRSRRLSVSGVGLPVALSQPAWS